MFFAWKEEYAVGIEAIDRDHKRLIASINELYEAMHDNTSAERIPDLLKSLTDYTLNHFAAEQAIMENIAYPDSQTHFREHGVMARKISDISARHKSGQVGISVELLLFLKNWLETHILKTDRALARHLEVNSKASSF